VNKKKKQENNIDEISFWKKIWLILETKEKWHLVGIFILQFIGSLVEIVGLGAIPAFILVLATPEKILSHKVVGGILMSFNITTADKLLTWGSAALIVIFIIKNAYLVLTGYIKSNYLRSLQVRYGMELFRKYMFADYTFLMGRNPAELLRNCITEVSTVVISILQGILNLFLDVLLIINITVVLFLMQPLVTIFTVAIIGAVAIIFLRFTRKKMERLGKKAQMARRSMVKAVNQGLHGIKETRIMHAEQFFIDDYGAAVQQTARSAKLHALVSSSIKPIFETLAVTALILITFLMYLQNKSIAGVIPVLSAFSIGMIRLLPAIREITSTISTLRYSFYSINPIYESKFIPEILHSPELSESFDEDQRVEFNDRLELKNISYTYPNSATQAVRDVSITVKKGEVVALVGSSGAGKTTLIDIITGLLTPDSGKMLVDGIDVSDRIKEWQMNLGYIPQFIYLADNTLRNNILWGRTLKKDSKRNFTAAIKAASLTELINQLPEGHGTVIGDRGTRLSGGQRQRVGIARAIYSNPDILVMDEATAALDNVTEREITKAINEMKGEKTMIIIAHRLSTVRNSDKMYLMEDGRIIASGTYDELLEISPEFKILHNAMEKD